MRSAAEWAYRFFDEVELRTGRGAGESGGGAVVVYMPGHLGDVLEATPMLKAVRAGAGGRRVVWLVGGWAVELARRYGGWADEVVEFSPQQDTLTRGGTQWRQGVTAQWRALRRLRRGGVDALIGTKPVDWLARFVANTLKPRVWAGIEDRRPPRVRADIRTEFAAYERDRPEAEAMLELAKRAGVADAGAVAGRAEFPVTGEERERAAAFLREEGAEGTLVLLAPGSGWSGKNWGAERFAELARRLEGRGVCGGWTGSAGEAELCRGPGRKWAGRLGLGELAAVMERAAAWVGNDSGTMHLAGAVGCRTVSFWGPTREGKWGVRGEGHVKLRGAEACPGCVYWDWRRTCGVEGHPCMAAIGVDAAEAVVARWLEEKLTP